MKSSKIYNGIKKTKCQNEPTIIFSYPKIQNRMFSENQYFPNNVLAMSNFTKCFSGHDFLENKRPY